MLTEDQNEKYLDLKSLCSILPITGIKSAVKWCENANIDIQIIGQKRVVYRFLVEMEIDKKLIKELKKKHPNKWEELYRCYRDNDRLGYLLLLDEEPELDFRPVARQSKPKSRFAQDFANS